MTTIAEVAVKLIADPRALIAESGLAGKEAGKAAGAGWSSGVALAAAAGLAAVVAITEKTTEWGNSVYLLTKQTGLSAETITAWQFAAQKMGLTADDMGTILGRFAVNAAKPNGPLEKMGINVRDASGAFLPMDALLNTVADRFAAMADGVGKTKEAVDIFGKSGRLMIPFLDEGSVGIKAMSDEAARLGVVLSDQDVESFHTLTIAQEELTQGLKGLGVSVSEAVVPVLTQVVGGLNTIAPILKIIGQNAGQIVPILDGLALALAVKTVGGFVAARAAAVGFGESTVVVAAESEVSSGVIVAAADSAALAWKTAIGVILILPELANLVGQAYDKVSASIFGSNLVAGKWNAWNATNTEGAKANADATSGESDAVDKLTAALNDAAPAGDAVAAAEVSVRREVEAARQAMDDASLSTANNADWNARLTDPLGLVGDNFGRVSDMSFAAMNSIDAEAAAASASVGPNEDAGNGAIDAASDFATLALQAYDAYSQMTKLALAESGAGEGAISAGQAAALGFGNISASATISLRAVSAHTSGTHGLTTAQKDLAATTKVDVTGAFNAEKTAFNALSQAIHDAEIRRITDEHAVSIAIAERTANDDKANLAAQKAAFFTNANADAAAFAAHQIDEQKTSLEQSAQAAQQALQSNTDPAQYTQLAAAYDQARQALADFTEQQRIAAEQSDAQKQADALDAANQTIDPITHAPTTKIDAALAAATAAADDTLAHDQKQADDRLAQQQKNFGVALDALEKHLTAVKGRYADANDAIARIEAAFGITMKPLGAKITLALADGLTSEVKAVETASETLANAVRKYIKVGSPAEKGPLHDDPPDEMGHTIGTEIGGGIAAGIDTTLPTWDDVLHAFVTKGLGAAQALAAQISHENVTSGKTGNPLAAKPGAGPAYTDAQSAALAGMFVDATGGPGLTQYGPGNPMLDSMRARAYGMDTTAKAVTNNVTVNNPVPERPSDTLHRLRVLSRTGQLPGS